MRNKRVKGIEPSCAAWEAAVLPLNYTRNIIFDLRFSITNCNRNKILLTRNCLAPHVARLNHCQEITSSESEKVVVAPLSGGAFASFPPEHAIITIARGLGPAHVLASEGFVSWLYYVLSIYVS